ERVGLRRPNWIFVTGDITDRGEKREWFRFRKCLEALPTAIQVILAPGNHDLVAAYGHDESIEKLRRFLEVQAALAPDFRTALGPRLRELESYVEEEVQQRVP